MPTAQPDLVQTSPGTPVTIPVLANDDGTSLRITGVENPAFGSIVLNSDQTITYTPGNGFTGVDSFGYTAKDSGNAVVHGLVTVTVRPPNHSPVANDDQASSISGQEVVIPVLANDNDPDGDPLKLVAFETPALGSLAVAGDQSIRYTAKAGQSGKDSFVYTISDGRGGVASAMVGVTIQPINQAPVANTGNVTTLVNTPLTINLLANVTDPDGDQLTLVNFTMPSHGTLAVTGPGKMLYTPTTGFVGLDGFNYTVSDGHSGRVTGLVNVQVVRSNSLPVAANDNATTVAGQPVAINVLANDSDPDGDSLTLVSLTLPSHGTLTVNAGQTLTYTPATGYVGGDEFTYTIVDGRGGSASGTVAVTVTAPTNPTSFINGYLNRRMIIVPARSVTGSAAHTSIVTGVTTFGNGPLLIGAGPKDSANGGWSGLIDEVRFQGAALSADWIATEYASHKDPQAFYGLGGENVYGDADQAPVAVPVTVSTNKGTAVDIDAVALAFDADTGAVLTIDQVGTPASGTAAIVAGKLRYTPNSGFIGQDSFTYRVSDGTKTSTSKVTVNVVQVSAVDNDKPYCNKFYGCLVHSDTIGNTRFTKGRPVSVRFRAERSGQITSFRWNLRYNGTSSQGKEETSYSTGDGGTVLVELRKNDPLGGAARWWPDMTAAGLLGKTLENNGEPGDLVGRAQYPIWSFTAPVTVTAGEIYHLVFSQLEDDQAVSVNLFSTLNPTPVGTGLHSGPYYGDDYAHLWALADYQTNGWFIRAHHVAFLEFIYGDGQTTGVGEWYTSNSAQKAIGGASMARERFTVQDYTRSVGGVWTRVWYEGGSPSDLVLRLENNDGSLIEQVSISRSQIALTDLTTAPAPWVYKAFAQPRTLVKGSSYRIRLSATTGNYQIIGIVDGGSKGYSSRNRWVGALAESSSDGGSTWRGWTVDKWSPTDYRTDMHLPVGFTVVG